MTSRYLGLVSDPRPHLPAYLGYSLLPTEKLFTYIDSLLSYKTSQNIDGVYELHRNILFVSRK